MAAEVYRVIFRPTSSAPKSKTIVAMGGSFEEVRKKFLSIYGENLLEIRYVARDNKEKN